MAITRLSQVGQSGMGKITNGQDYIDALATQYVVKPPRATGIGGFVFDYEGTISIDHQADITDHWTEANSAIQDHIAIKPIKITLQGFVSELALRPTTGLVGALGVIQDKLGLIPGYTNGWSPQMATRLQKAVTTATNAATAINTAIARAGNIVDMIPGASSGETKQQQAYRSLVSMYKTKQLMYVVTPYTTYPRMVISALSFTQDDTTKTITDITVTLKQLNFASVTYTAYDPTIFAAQASAQRQSIVDAGKTKGQDKSILYTLVH